MALIGRNILNDTSPTGGIDFNNLTGYVNEPTFLEHGIGAAIFEQYRISDRGWVSGYREQRSVEGGLRLAYLFPNADIEVALIGRNILNDTSPTGGIDFNNLTGYVNEPRFWSMELVRRF